MIRSFLLSTTVAVGLLAATPPAHALLGVGDIVFDPTNLETAVNSFKQLQSVYTGVTNVYGALSHPTSVRGIASSLSSAGVQTPLTQFGDIQSAVGGLTSGNVQGAVNALRQSNQYYAPTGNDFAATDMAQRATGTANVQAMAMTNLQSLQDRAAGIQELTAKIDSGDITDMTALANRFHAEQQYLSIQQAQATNMQTLLMAQSQVNDQRLNEKQRMDAEALINCTSGAASNMGVANFGAASNAAGTQTVSQTAPAVPAFGGGG